MNLAFLIFIEYVKGRMLSILKRWIEGESVSSKEIIRTAFLTYLVIVSKFVSAAMLQLSRL